MKMKKMVAVSVADQKPHAVCIPFPAQGHINPMLKLAKLLYVKGFYITFVNTEYNHKRLLKSRGSHALDSLPGFRFETIPDGLPPTDAEITQDIRSLCESTTSTALVPFRNLLAILNNSGSISDSDDGKKMKIPPVSCIVSDGVMSFTLKAAEEIGVPIAFLWTTSACGFLGYMQYPHLVQRGIVPLKDAGYLTNGYLESIQDWIPGMKNIRLRDLPTFLRTTDVDDFMIKFVIQEGERAKKASAIILNTFEPLERDVLQALSTILPPIYTVGPLTLMTNHINDDRNLASVDSNLWKEESECLDWLNSKEPNSVVYVNFGSITVMTTHQLVEFAFGLANSQKSFLWIIRPDLVAGESAIFPPEFVCETKDRGMLASWCHQEEVLKHPSIGGFLTHSGWNSTLETLSGGVPVISWPFFAEQQTNCWYSCNDWGIGMEIDSDVKRDEVEKLVRELMDGEKGKEMKRRAIEWKRIGEEATGYGGSSYHNLDKLINEVLLSRRT